MKKNLTVLFLGLFVLVAFSACSKDYTCNCTVSSSGISSTSSSVINGTKSEAEEACDALDASVGEGESAITTECSID